jgi:hypothetical protein
MEMTSGMVCTVELQLVWKLTAWYSLSLLEGRHKGKKEKRKGKQREKRKRIGDKERKERNNVVIFIIEQDFSISVMKSGWSMTVVTRRIDVVAGFIIVAILFPQFYTEIS